MGRVFLTPPRKLSWLRLASHREVIEDGGLPWEHRPHNTKATPALRQQLKVLTRRRPEATVFSTRPIVLGDVAMVPLGMEAGIEWWMLKSKQVRPAPTAHLRTSE